MSDVVVAKALNKSLGTKDFKGIDEILSSIESSEISKAKLLAATGGKIQSWEDVQKVVRMGIGEFYFPIGTQFFVKKGEKDVIFEVAAHNIMQADGNIEQPSMTLITRDLQTLIPFSYSKYVAKQAVSKGTPSCYVTLRNIGGPTANCYIPVATIADGSVLGFRINNYGAQATFDIDKFDDEGVAHEVASDIPISFDTNDDALYLGKSGEYNSNIGKALPSYEELTIGSRDYSSSRLRHYLNGENLYYEGKMGYYDIRPSVEQYGQKGFLYELDKNFVNVLATISQTYGAGSLKTKDKVFTLTNQNVFSLNSLSYYPIFNISGKSAKKLTSSEEYSNWWLAGLIGPQGFPSVSAEGERIVVTDFKENMGVCPAVLIA